MSDSPNLTRVLQRRFLKPECVAEYRHQHDNIWPDLVALYREHGITTVSCFLNGNELAVFFEYDTDTFEPRKNELAAHPVEQKWQGLMATYDDPSQPAVVFEEVYRLDRQ